MPARFEPRIVIYLCGSPAFVDRPSYVPNVQVVKKPGSVETDVILNAFVNEGADGVMVVQACRDGAIEPSGGLTGARWLMDTLGLDRKRLRFEAVANTAASGDVVADFVEEVRGLGPNVLSLSTADQETSMRMASWLEALQTVSEALDSEKLPPSKAVIFSQAFRLSAPYRARVPAADNWIVADALTCVGCRICEAVCSESHEGIYNPELARIHIANDPFRRYVRVNCVQDHCRQCAGAECLVACPTGALRIDPFTGARVIEQRLCIGCRSCQDACQYHMITYQAEQNVCIKCDLCGGDPECVKACPAGALKYVSTTGVA